MITIDTLNKLHEARLIEAAKPDGRYSTPPKRMFNEDGTFNHDNWNGGDAIIRKFINDLDDKNDIIYECITHENKTYDLICTSRYYDYHYYINITIISNDSDTVNQVFFRIYKVRGCIEMARYDGQNMTVDQYILLLNLLQSAGYNFKLFEKINNTYK